MAFASLLDASIQCSTTMFTRWNAGTLKANLTTFTTATSGLFSDGNPKERTVGDWYILIQSLTSQLQAAFSASDLTLFNQISAVMYRYFAQCDARVTGGQISNAQGAAVLAAANVSLA
jgi:hypothetical protein